MIDGAFYGSFFHAPEYGKLEFLENALIEVDEAGVIVRVVHEEDPEQERLLGMYLKLGILTTIGEGFYCLPGFVDIHVHAPQWPQAALALDEPLYQWLEERTFPLESMFADIEFSRAVYSDLVKQLLARGSTTVMYLGSAHLESSIALAEICASMGQRTLVGKTVMDDPTANPEYYRDASPAQALADTVTLIKEVEDIGRRSRAGAWPVVTPRFIPSCTDEVLKGLGDIAENYGTYIQTHCNEGQWEHDVVLERFGKTDPYALYDFGLLRDHSVMAHCPYLTEEEGELFVKVGATIAHCPMANSYFSSAVAPIRRFREQGIEVGLGTDISGGYSPSMYENIRQAVLVSRLLETGVDAQRPEAERGLGTARISLLEAFWLATTGGAEALDLPVGAFEPGRAFDMQVVDVKREYYNLTGFGVYNSPEDRLARILYLSTPDNIRKVYAQGRLVVDKDAE